MTWRLTRVPNPFKIQSELTVNTLLDSLGLTPGVAARLRECKRTSDEVTGQPGFGWSKSTETAFKRWDRCIRRALRAVAKLLWLDEAP